MLSALQLPAQSPTDPQATEETRNLYLNLHGLRGRGLMFGHQDALAYGIGWNAARLRADVNDVCGDFPAVFGWDLSKLGSRRFNIDTVSFRKMRKWMIHAYEMGGINTISWHLDNPLTGGDSWDTTPAVPAILPGGPLHAEYVKRLDEVADYIEKIQSKGRPVPIIFRPFHEHTGGWFWWGANQCTPEQYKALWHFTVKYLRDTRGLHNLLYAYSTDIFTDKAHYLERYPGDEYVDLMGMDDYHDVSPKGNPADLTRRLAMLGELAREHNKVAALTETGQNTISTPNWWTDVLLNAVKSDSLSSEIVYALVWRNDRPDHVFGPYPAHPSASDFVRFYEDSSTLFIRDLPPLYRAK
ncbi:MAG: beta-mannosidase [Bacteroidetes bacterium]|nr:MAG: beta-mannosidase [Bacteroidota bacterium]